MIAAIRAAAALVALVGAGARRVASQSPPPPAPEQRFVVLGHIRGNAGQLSPKLAELLDRVRALSPEFVVLTGDIIFGDLHSPRTDPAKLELEWDQVDSALATLGVPIYRVPGNHDISDVPSRDVWWRRYGSLPAAVTIGTMRLLLLPGWIPADGDPRHNPYVRGTDLDSAQVAFLERELSSGPPVEHTFVFLHYLLWWDADDSHWWRTVHPLLAGARVDAVFSGDYGPLKFSTMERDGVSYYQSSVELPVDLPMLQNRISSRLLSAQFDNFLEVVVRGPSADVRVHTTAEVSSQEFTPSRYRAINETAPPAQPVWRRVWKLVGSPRRLAAIGLTLMAVFAAGWWAGGQWRHRRSLG